MNENIRYITDAQGNKLAVILPLEDYENLLEELELLSAAYESRNEPSRPLDDVIAEMRAAGEIDV
jgi:PHD/YefM family antitoxin component YafN of YafNO toxin-antitoxin module